MPASRGGAKYVFLILDDFSDTGWPLLLKDKSADTRLKISVDELPGTFRSDNGSEFNNPVFRALLEEYKVTTQLPSVDGPERNGKVERRIGMIKLAARAAFLDFPLLFPGVVVPRVAPDYDATWPEAWVWASEKFNCTARVHLPDKRCPEE
ncbi:unnamed protein product, partial [Hapterophycus canaliculatus]